MSEIPHNPSRPGSSAEHRPCPGGAALDPRVSLLMVARDAEDHIDAALLSARAQTFRHIEIVVVDDGSTDATADIARDHSRRDARVRLVAGPRRGLAAVRNASLDAALGRYGAIIDSDDLLHPEHVEVLFSVATRHRAEIVAANMLCFSDTVPRRAGPFAHGREWRVERSISPEEFVRSGRLDARGPSLGYLKPLFDLRFLRGSDLRYDPRLRIGEDYDLVDRALRAGARCIVSPRMTYFYRRHDKSTSHRLAREDLQALIASEREKRSETDCAPLARASLLRERSLKRALAHVEAVEALKARAPGATLRALTREPRVPLMLAASAFEGLARRLRALPGRAEARKTLPGRALLIGHPSRGSAIAGAARCLRAQGYEMHRMRRADRAGAGLRIARTGPFDAILLADESALALTPFALSPGAPLIGDETIDPALVDIVATGTGDGRLADAPGEGRADRAPDGSPVRTLMTIGEAIARFRTPAAAVAAE